MSICAQVYSYNLGAATLKTTGRPRRSTVQMAISATPVVLNQFEGSWSQFSANFNGFVAFTSSSGAWMLRSTEFCVYDDDNNRNECTCIGYNIIYSLHQTCFTAFIISAKPQSNGIHPSTHGTYNGHDHNAVLNARKEVLKMSHAYLIHIVRCSFFLCGM